MGPPDLNSKNNALKMDEKLKGYHDYKNILEDKILQLKLKVDSNVIQKRKFDQNKFRLLKSKHILNIMELINFDFYHLWTCNKLFHDAILNIFKEEAKKIGDKFKNQFSNLFEIVEMKLVINKAEKNKRPSKFINI